MSAQEAVRYYDWLGKSGMLKAAQEMGTHDDFETVRQLVRPGDRVLDLGCGYGRLTAYMASIASEVCGLDISPVLIAEARKEAEKAAQKAVQKEADKESGTEAQKESDHESPANLSYIVADMRRLPYADEHFDKVLCFWNSFNHLLAEIDQLACLHECYRVLKSGGLAFFVLPDIHTEPWLSIVDTAENGIVTWTLPPNETGESIIIRSFVHTEETIAKVVSQTDFELKVETRSMNNGLRLVVHLLKR